MSVWSRHKQTQQPNLLRRTACCCSCVLHWRRSTASRGVRGGVIGGCLERLWGLVTIPHEVQLQQSMVQELLCRRCLGAVQDEFAQQHQRHRPEHNPYSSIQNQAYEGEWVSRAGGLKEGRGGSMGSPSVGGNRRLVASCTTSACV